MPKYTMGPDDEDYLEPRIPKKPLGQYRGRTEVYNVVPEPGTQAAPNSPMSVQKERLADGLEQGKRPTMQWPVASPLDTSEPEEIIVIDDSEIEEKSGLKKIPVDDKPQITRIPETLQVLDFKHTPQAPQTATTPEETSHLVRNAVIAATVAVLGYTGYKGYGKLFPQGSDESHLDWPSLKDNFIKDSKNSNTVSGEIEILPMPVDMKEARVEPGPIKEPSIIVAQNPFATPSSVSIDKPVKTEVKTEVKPEVKTQSVDSKNVGLVKIDKASLDKLPEGDYKKMYQGVGFYVNEVPGRSITALIEKHLMGEAKTKQQKEAYRTNLRRTEKGWLIYMRQLELKVEAQIAKGETVNERDMADYDYWKIYKLNHRNQYDKAKWLAGKYRRLERGKKNSWEFKRYQEYLTLGTSLMEGLRELNPEVASVNDVQNWQQVRVADNKGHVLEYLLDVSKRMKLPVPEPLVVAQNVVNVPEKISTPKIQTSAKQSQVVSGVISLDVDLPTRKADLNSYQAVSDLEDIMFGVQKVAVAEDSFDNLFPWERFETAKAAETKVEEITIDAENWPDSNDEDTKILAQTGAFAVDNGSHTLDEKDLYAEYKVEDGAERGEEEEDFYAEYKVETAPEVAKLPHEEKKQGFFSKAVSKVKGWFSKK